MLGSANGGTSNSGINIDELSSIMDGGLTRSDVYTFLNYFGLDVGEDKMYKVNTTEVVEELAKQFGTLNSDLFKQILKPLLAPIDTNITVDNEEMSLLDYIDQSLNYTVGDVVDEVASGGDNIIEVSLNPLIDSLLGIDLIDEEIIWKYSVIEGFDKPNGKYPNTLGNVAIIDCHYITDNFEALIERTFKRIEEVNPILALVGRQF